MVESSSAIDEINWNGLHLVMDEVHGVMSRKIVHRNRLLQSSGILLTCFAFVFHVQNSKRLSYHKKAIRIHCQGQTFKFCLEN